LQKAQVAVPRQRTAVRLVQKLACPLGNLLRVDRSGERLGRVACAKVAHEIVIKPLALCSSISQRKRRAVALCQQPHLLNSAARVPLLAAAVLVIVLRTACQFPGQSTNDLAA
jgi:hypothetical protein